MSDDLTEAREKLNAASQREWRTVVRKTATPFDPYAPDARLIHNGGINLAKVGSDADAEWIAYAHNHAAEWFAKIEALEAENAELRALVGDKDYDAEHWASCSRAEAIRQANEFHAGQLHWMSEHDKRRAERDAATRRADEMEAENERLERHRAVWQANCEDNASVVDELRDKLTKTEAAWEREFHAATRRAEDAEAAIARIEALCDEWAAPTRRKMHAHEWSRLTLLELHRAALAAVSSKPVEPEARPWPQLHPNATRERGTVALDGTAGPSTTETSKEEQ